MLVYTPFALCFVTLRGIFMHFPEPAEKAEARRQEANCCEGKPIPSGGALFPAVLAAEGGGGSLAAEEGSGGGSSWPDSRSRMRRGGLSRCGDRRRRPRAPGGSSWRWTGQAGGDSRTAADARDSIWGGSGLLISISIAFFLGAAREQVSK
jgi:hypothetical protein